MSACSAPSTAAQNAAMALALIGPNARSNVTFEVADEQNGAEEEEGPAASGGGKLEDLGSTQNSGAVFVESAEETGRGSSLK